MGKGFGQDSPRKPKMKPVLSTLNPEDTERVLFKMYDFLGWEDNAKALGRMALRRYLEAKEKGAVVAAPWQSADPEIIPTDYMTFEEIRDAGLAYPTVLDSYRRYKPHAEFLLIYWEQDTPETMAACQVISLQSPAIHLYQKKSK
ncbi:hypothetical protein [Acaryochloris marina]|uniref:hypothetical protein n=1 Tax=Acaryochloris marina TaxID=155978 RepID=UPI0021C3902F|nr:hypothetical protein [Acaryochloris marina]BDM82042.1 hypothetical protein AM10699_49060 [Acaryochloris marina MBIC10699]